MKVEMNGSMVNETRFDGKRVGQRYGTGAKLEGRRRKHEEPYDLP